MEDPTKKKLDIISGEAEVTPKGKPISPPPVVVPAMDAPTQIMAVPQPRTLEELISREQFSPEQKAQCSKRCGIYLREEGNLTRYLSLMGEILRKKDSLTPHFALHLPAVFSLPSMEQENLLAVMKENLTGGENLSAYLCVLEAHQEILRARIYSGLDRLKLNHNDRNNQSIWIDLNNAFAHHAFLQAKAAEEPDEFSEQEQRLEFLEQIVPHYLEMAGLVSSRFAEEKPTEARVIARRIALEYASFHDEKSLEEVFERVNQYTLGELEKVGKTVQPEGRESRLEHLQEQESSPVQVTEQTPREYVYGLAAENDTLRKGYSEEQETRKTLEQDVGKLTQLLENVYSELNQLKAVTHPDSKEGEAPLPEIRSKVSEYIVLNQQLTEAKARLEEQINASAKEAVALRKQYVEHISPAAHRAALENEFHALKTQYEQYISPKEYHQKATEWGAAKKKLEDAVKEAKNASAPSRSGGWKLAAALGALGVSLAAGGVLYFSEARQNEELTQWVGKLNVGNQECVKANDSLLQEGRGLMKKVKFYEKQSCAEYTK